jgi:fructokinase
MNDLMKAIKKIARENPEGFTVEIPTLNHVSEGYIAAFLETQNSFGDEGLRKVINHALQHGKIVGGWLNSENKQYYFDSSQVFTDLEEAIKFGNENRQIAVFDLTNFREIRL